jgi:hypothetical protein
MASPHNLPLQLEGLPDSPKIHCSVSSLELYERCPREYKAWKVDGRVPPFARALRRGTDVHEQIAAHLRGEPVRRPHRSFLAFTRSRFNRVPLLIEHSFEAELAPCYVVGRIDAMYAAGGGIEIVDWKSGSGSKELYDAALQLPLYCMAIANLWNRPLTDFRYSYFSLESEQEHAGAMSPELAEQLERRVQLLVAGIQAEDYSRGCGKCWVCVQRAGGQRARF